MGKITNTIKDKYLVARDSVTANKILNKIKQKQIPQNILFSSEKEAARKIMTFPRTAQGSYFIFKVTEK